MHVDPTQKMSIMARQNKRKMFWKSLIILWLGNWWFESCERRWPCGEWPANMQSGNTNLVFPSMSSSGHPWPMFSISHSLCCSTPAILGSTNYSAYRSAPWFRKFASSANSLARLCVCVCVCVGRGGWRWIVVSLLGTKRQCTSLTPHLGSWSHHQSLSSWEDF